VKQVSASSKGQTNANVHNRQKKVNSLNKHKHADLKKHHVSVLNFTIKNDSLLFLFRYARL